MKKKALSLALALVMCLGLLPATALAADSDFTIYDGVLRRYTGPGGDVTIPDSVTSIGDSAFQNCTSLTSVTIPDGVTSIEDRAFYKCTNLTSVTIPDSVTSIGGGAFRDCTSLTNVTIPDGVTEIGGSAFFNCKSLTSITIPDGAKVELMAFSFCTSLTEATTTSMGDGMFCGCTNLTSVTIRKGADYISDNAFGDCTALTSITIPDGVTGVGENAFQGCESLTRATIPASVTSVRWDAFSVPNLKDIYYSGTEAQWKEIEILRTGPYSNFPLVGGATIHYNGSTTSQPQQPTTPTQPSDPADFEIENGVLTKYNGKGGNVVIPDGVTEIKEGVFSFRADLTSVTIPNSVTSIGSRAFMLCENLTNVTIPGSVTSIGSYAFDHCIRLTSVTIQNGVTSIEIGAFKGCTALTSVTIPNSVTKFGGSEYGDAFEDTPWLKSLGEFAVVNGILLKYQGSSGDVVIPGNITSIGDYAFGDCPGLTSVTIPNGVTSIRSKAFMGCGKLTSMTIPSSVNSIEEMAFYACSGLKDIYYGGTAEQWNALDVNFINPFQQEAPVIHYSGSAPQQPQQPAGTQAMPTNDKLTRDGEAQDPTVYKIDGSNYFKIRDLAAILNSTDKQFSVGYDSEKQSVTVTTGEAYTMTDTELKGAASSNEAAEVSNDAIYVNGKKVEAEVYKIGGNNYFKLRDLGKALDFYVGWSADKGMYIDSGRSYDADQ